MKTTYLIQYVFVYGRSNHRRRPSVVFSLRYVGCVALWLVFVHLANDEFGRVNCGGRRLFFNDFFLVRYMTNGCFQFRKKTLGYDTANVTAAKTLESLYNHLQTTTKWYPGEGEPVIDFLMTVTTFLQTSYNLADLDRASDPFDSILTMLLKNDSIVSDKVCTRCSGPRSLTAENRWIFQSTNFLVFKHRKHKNETAPSPQVYGPINMDISKFWIST